jgi:hypothetical protein
MAPYSILLHYHSCMNNQSDQQRIKIIYQMLFEMAIDNLTFRIQLNGSDSQLNEMAAILNTMAEKMQLVISQSGYIKSHYVYKNDAAQSDAVMFTNTSKPFRISINKHERIVQNVQCK